MESMHILHPVRNSELMMVQAVKFPKIMSELYFGPQWHEYNKGLARLTRPGLSKGPISKKGTGHLIHRDDPRFVAEEIMEIIDKLRQDEASHI